MASGDHDWIAGEQVTAGNVDDYLQLQALQKHATSAARDSALTTRKREGMHTYQDDSNCDTVYSGSAWSTIGPVHGALPTYVPVLTQSGAVAKTVNNASYTRTGRWCSGNIWFNLTAAGTANSAVTISTPFTALTTSAVVGAGYFYDASTTTILVVTAALLTTTTFAMYGATAGGFLALGLTGSVFGSALASSDIINFSYAFECAADA